MKLAATTASSQPVSHDDTGAITNAFNAANATGATLYSPVGTYEFCGTALGSAVWNNINVRGAKINAPVIDLYPGQYLFEPDAQVSGADIERLTFNGGAGVYRNISSAAISQGYATHVFADNVVWNFTGTAFSQVINDEPFGSGNTFINDPGIKYLSNQSQGMSNLLGSAQIRLGRPNRWAGRSRRTASSSVVSTLEQRRRPRAGGRRYYFACFGHATGFGGSPMAVRA